MTDSLSPAKGPGRALELALEAEVRAQLVRDLYDRSRIAIVTMLILIGVIRWAMDPAYQADGRVRMLFGVLIAISLIRLAMAMIPAHRRDAIASSQGQVIWFTGAVAISSLTLGAMVALAWPLLDPTRLAIVAVLTSGLVSGAVMSLGFSPLVYMIYMIPPMGALFLLALTDQRPPWGADILATAFALFAVFVFAISFDQRRTRRQAIELGLRLSEMAVRDSLTQLHNRRFLQDFMVIEEARLARETTALEQGHELQPDSVMGVYMLDLDFFKQVNDVHGHAAGDAVLKQTAAVLTATLRKSDNLVRWGGEEFVAVAWVRTPEHPRVVAEKLRRAIELAVIKLPNGKILKKTVSMGFCVMPFFADQPLVLNWEQVLALADAALYLAKAEGRNRWVGIKAGSTAWPDAQQICADVLHDLKGAAERGLVTLERSQTSSS